MTKYTGSCLCKSVTYTATTEAENPHLCSCTMCQKSSGAPTVAWLEFSLKDFKWTGSEPKHYQSSKKTKRIFCPECGCLFGAVNDGIENISITIASLDNPNQVTPTGQHSYSESASRWWEVSIKSDPS